MESESKIVVFWSTSNVEELSKDGDLAAMEADLEDVVTPRQCQHDQRLVQVGLLLQLDRVGSPAASVVGSKAADVVIVVDFVAAFVEATEEALEVEEEGLAIKVTVDLVVEAGTAEHPMALVMALHHLLTLLPVLAETEAALYLVGMEAATAAHLQTVL